jgi:hypothetical protein
MRELATLLLPAAALVRTGETRAGGETPSRAARVRVVPGVPLPQLSKPRPVAPAKRTEVQRPCDATCPAFERQIGRCRGMIVS